MRKIFLCKILLIVIILLSFSSYTFAFERVVSTTDEVLFTSNSKTDIIGRFESFAIDDGKESFYKEDDNVFAVRVKVKRDSVDRCYIVKGDNTWDLAAGASVDKWNIGIYEVLLSDYHPYDEEWIVWLWVKIELINYENKKDENGKFVVDEDGNPIQIAKYAAIVQKSIDDNDDEVYNPEDEADSILEDALAILDRVSEIWDSIKYFVQDLGKNLFGTLMNIFSDIAMSLFGDSAQILANMAQQGDFRKITYGKTELESEGILGEHNKYANIGMTTSTGTTKKQIEINTKVRTDESDDVVSNDGEQGVEDRGFNVLTKIPVIPVELYGMATGNISLLDINIFETGRNNGSVWMLLRNFGTLLMRITIYVVTAFLIIVLIWNGVMLTGKTLTPDAKANYKKGLEHFFKSIFMLVGVVAIMSIFIYASEMVLDIVNLDNKEELPIRVTVKDDNKVIYCFSTNLTGYVRYMCQNNNVNLYGEKAAYTLIYIILAITNLISAFIMLARMLAMMFLGIIGPIMVGFYAIGKEDKFPIKFRRWVILYGVLASLQFLIAIVYKILLEYTII